jgi:hypothetical protein
MLQVTHFCFANPRTFYINGEPTQPLICNEGDIIVIESEKDTPKIQYIVSTIVPSTEHTSTRILLRSAQKCKMIAQNEKEVLSTTRPYDYITPKEDDLFNARINQIETRSSEQYIGMPIKIFGEEWLLEKANITLDDKKKPIRGYERFKKPINFFCENQITFFADQNRPFGSHQTFESPISIKYYRDRIAAAATAGVVTTLGCMYLLYKKFGSKN